MKKKNFLAFVLAMVMMLATTMTSFAAWTYHFPGWWAEDGNGKWWQVSWNCVTEISDYYSNEWRWIDDDRDGIAECYYFDSNGYLMVSTTTPDGCTVNENGAWVVDGVVQTDNIDNYTEKEGDVATAVPVMDVSNAVKDASGATITANAFFTERTGYQKTFNSSDFSNINFVKTDDAFEFTEYTGEYNGLTITVRTGVSSGVEKYSAFGGPAKAFFSGIPESGMEIYAFLESYGNAARSPIDNAIVLGLMANSGDSTDKTGYPRASCLMTNAAHFDYYDTLLKADTYMHFTIVLTPGSDGHYYVFPDTVVWM